MRISVIIPCYNCENTIEKCILSVLKQTSTVFEIICINDGSTDGTLTKLYDIQSKFCKLINLIVLSQENSGPSVARNNGILKSKGEWIAFLDSDDCWHERKIEIFTEFLLNNEAAILGSLDGCEKYKKIEFNDLIWKNFFVTSSVLVEKNCILENLFDSNQKYSEDYKVWLKIIYKYNGFIISPNMSKPIDFNKGENVFYMGSGLSSKLWLMEKAELENYKYLLDKKMISYIKFLGISMYSLLKFFRRVLLVNFKKNNLGV